MMNIEPKGYDSLVHILSYDRKNIVAEIINTLNSASVTITSISSSKNKDGDLVTKIKLHCQKPRQFSTMPLLTFIKYPIFMILSG
jgi:(p)ppGpp synthase/HD superfamily hydrolase